MGSVDKTDQMLQPYNPARKSYTWFKKMGIHVASRMLLNAFILHKHCQSENMRFKDFIISCCRGILENTVRITGSPLVNTQKKVKF